MKKISKFHVNLNMEKKFFNPYVGSHYQEGLINNKKVLVLGASHYCTYGPSSNIFNCPFWSTCTSKKSKDSSRFDMCCPYYQSIGWYDKYEYVRLSNSPRIELENYLSDGGYITYDNFSKSLTNLLNLPNAQCLWDRLAFVNYVQYFLPTQITPTLTRDDIGCFKALIKYVEQLKPDIIIAWGTQITAHFNHNYIRDLVKQIKIRDDNYFWDFETSHHKCLIVNPYHPSDFAPWHCWSNNIEAFQSSLLEALELKSIG